MDRREFAAAAAAFMTAGWERGARALATLAPARVNGARLNARLSELSKFGANPQGGVSRLAYGDADRAARAAVIEWMRAAGLAPRIDVAANIVGRREGRDRSLKPLLIASHIDSVPEGGNYDGNVGSLAAIEVAQCLAEQRTTLRHPLEVIVWSNEEGGLYGSRAVGGQLQPKELDVVSRGGPTIRDGVASIGGDPARIFEARRAPGSIAGYLELHIEQGGVLEATGTDIGIVEGIVGIRQWDVTITGFANHAGTTPMDQRRDAMLAAARFTEAVNRVIRSMPGRQVGTVGRIQAFPGAPNVIPGRVLCSLEIRDLDDAKIAMLSDRIRAEASAIAEQTGTTFEYADLFQTRSAPCDPRARTAIASAARALSLSTREMPSGAGHDAQSMAPLGPIGMIFIPSIGGISHSPKEFSRPEDITNGANVLFGALLEADRWD